MLFRQHRIINSETRSGLCELFSVRTFPLSLMLVQKPRSVRRLSANCPHSVHIQSRSVHSLPANCPHSVWIRQSVHSLCTYISRSVGRLSPTCQQSVYVLSVVYRQTVGGLCTYNHVLSAVCRQTVVCLSASCPQSVNELSTVCP